MTSNTAPGSGAGLNLSASFRKMNTIAGWLIFLFAQVVYMLTMEPTVSYWDCGEFILSAIKLEIVHPPGAPLFAMAAKVFSLFGGAGNEAFMVNMFSATSSAFTIMFLFWIVTHFAGKLIHRGGEAIEGLNAKLVIVAGVIAATAATFTDSFWFSAVEGEVYAFAAFFTMLVVWAMTKWERIADEPHADRWFVFIAFVIGLSVGTHLLALLALPALAFMYYFRRYEPTRKGVLITLVVGGGLLGFVMFGVLDYYVRFAAKLDLLFVNSLNLPFWSGVYFWLLLTLGGAVALAVWAHRKKKAWVHTAALSFIMLVVGFSCYTMVPIRAAANPPINMNRPSDIHVLHSYLKREQYGHRPLFYGPAFMAQPLGSKDKGWRWMRQGDRYVKAEQRFEYDFASSRAELAKYNLSARQIENLMQRNKQMLFPRMTHLELNRADHGEQYRAWLNLGPNEIPDYGDNIKFAFNYQLKYMYWRYFMWNFSGRQNGGQGHIGRGLIDGNWITGIPAIDRAQSMAGDALDAPRTQKSKAYNKFFMIPFFLGIIGLYFHFTKSRRDFIVLAILFFFTGIMLIFNSNEPPSEPRERDYALALSFLTFAMWLGFGFMGLFELIKRKLAANQALILAGVLSVLAPVLMGSGGWDDHDRSDRYLAHASGRAYLESCDQNAILFCQGDNDTYPLWYLQEVEGVRRDIRIINLSLVAVDWYIEQLHNKVNDSDPLNLRFTMDDYMGRRMQSLNLGKPNPQNPQAPAPEDANYLRTYGRDLDKALDFAKNNSNYLPLRSYEVSIDSNWWMANGAVPEGYEGQIQRKVPITFGKNKTSLFRDDIILLDIIANNINERPIHFNYTVPNGKRAGLGRFCKRTGLTDRLMPIDFGRQGWLDTDVMYENMTEKWSYGNLDARPMHLEEWAHHQARMMQQMLTATARELVEQKDTSRARDLVEIAVTKFPDYSVPYMESSEISGVIEALHSVGSYTRYMELLPIALDLIESDLITNMESKRMKRHVQTASAAGLPPQDFLRFYMQSSNGQDMPFIVRNVLSAFVTLGFIRGELEAMQKSNPELGIDTLLPEINQRFETLQARLNVNNPYGAQALKR